ncbi:MAG TPA: MBL fold metallo-hydrolase [Mycobacteriales bacterium]|nr:MBL fold metallo-hydrolase [Mycobacteriales bacterium]
MTELEAVTASASRLLAPNPGPMTLDGTNTWVLRAPGGDQGAVVVDPGPVENGHIDKVAALGRIAAIVLTHGHFDHGECAPELHERTGAPVIARDPSLCLGADPIPDRPGRTTLAGLEWLTVLTPGHSSDSVSFVLESDRALLTGDSVLGRGTAVVAHPDGVLGDYLDSLQRLRDIAAGDIDVILPGHGPVVDRPLEVMEYYLAHRAERLEQVRAALAAGDDDEDAVVRRVYADVDESLWPHALLSVRAQLDYLREHG